MALDNFHTKADQACQAGEQFIKLYYDGLDKRRQALSKLYMDTATLLWNGNNVSGAANIIKFHDALPSTEHTVECLDCQPLKDFVTAGQTTILVTTGGVVKYEGNREKVFNQNFILTTQETADKQITWKIVSDCIRFHTN